MTPPPALSAAALIQPEVEVPDSVVNRDLLAPLGRPSLGYWALLGAAVLVVVYGISVWLYQIYIGMGVA
ncbi:MAG TPA: hypothetical protein VFG80_05655, partial [Myxococcota bacterium]|nr:hypothetical protein [Myxococcota bacterium]